MFIPTDDGRWVSEEYERLARYVKDYDPALELRWIPPDKRTREDKKPYVVWDTRTDSAVLYANELDTPVEIVERLYLADNEKASPLERIVAHNLAIENLQQQRWNDEREDMIDQARFLIGSPLNTVKFNGKKLDHLRRPVL